MKLYYNPLSSYSQKVLFAFYEKGVEFTPEIVNVMDPAAKEAYKAAVNPLGKVPALVLDDGWRIPESTIICEWLDQHHPATPRLIPDDADLARQTRFHDRMFDLYLNDPMSTIFFDGLKPEAAREPGRVARAKATLDTMFREYDKHFATRTWAMGDTFSLADVAAASPLTYLRRAYTYEAYPNLVAYAGRVTSRPAFQRVWREAEPMMAAFAR